jgi:hypothetical protein
MAHYFCLVDSSWFYDRFRPALAASWRQKSFQPCRQLCAALNEAADRFAATYNGLVGTSIVTAVAAGLAFDRHVWRCLVGEALLYGASEIPEIHLAVECLTRLLAPNRAPRLEGPRELLAPVQQALFGARDLEFGSAIYRPEQVGMNDTTDVQRLADYFESVEPREWTTADLGVADPLLDDEESAAELEYVRECFSALCQMYVGARNRRQVIICETP